MAKITLQNRTLETVFGETVLACLLRHQFDMPFSCKEGDCQSCKIRAVKGAPPVISQRGLNETEKARNYFLACLCCAEEDLEIVLSDEELPQVKTRVCSIERLNESVVRIRLKSPPDYPYFAGQHLRLYNDDGLSRAYCLSSVPGLDDYLELQITLAPGGKMVPWIYEHLKGGSEVRISRASGHCFYAPGNRTQPIILVGTGIALAPVYGIVRDALIKNGHTGPIQLYHETHGKSEYYLVQELKNLEKQYPNLTYTHYLSGKDVPVDVADMSASEMALGTLHDLGDWRIYLCGDPAMIAEVTKDALLLGAKRENLYTLPFRMPPSSSL